MKIQKVEVIPSELGLITATLAFMAGFATESQYSLYLQPTSLLYSNPMDLSHVSPQDTMDWHNHYRNRLVISDPTVAKVMKRQLIRKELQNKAPTIFPLHTSISTKIIPTMMNSTFRLLSRWSISYPGWYPMIGDRRN